MSAARAGQTPVRETAEMFASVALVCLLAVASVLRLWPERRWAARVIGSLFRKVLACFKSSKMVDPMEQRVRMECERRRLERARALVGVSCIAHIPPAVQFMRVIADDEPRGLMYTFLGSGGLVAFMAFFPNALTSKTIDIIYSLAMVLLIANTCLLGQGLVDFNWTIGGWLIALGWGLFNTKVWLNFVWLAALAFGISAALMSLGATAANDNWRYLLGATCFLAWLDSCFESSVRLQIRAKDSGTQFTAVRTLLDSICDVVIELDSSLRLALHSPKLADILMQSPSRSLEGTGLQEFMPVEGDRTAFEEHLQGGCGEAGSEAVHDRSCVFHTNLRDSIGSNVAMELFAVAYEGTDAKRRHLLGMREFTDVQPMAKPPQRRLPEPRNARVPAWHGTPAVLSRTILPESERAESEGRSSRSSRSSRRSSSNGSKADGRPRRIRTANVVKRMTLVATLNQWNLTKRRGHCCAWHSEVQVAQGILAGMMSDHCNLDLGQKEETHWQCMRCGIMAKEFRMKIPTHACRACQDIPSNLLPRSGSAQAQFASL